MASHEGEITLEDEGSDAPPGEPRGSAFMELLAPLGLMLLAAALRVWQLGAHSLWLDELFTVSITSGGVRNAIVGAAADTSPALYFIIQAMLVPVLGRSEVAVRVFPVVTSVLTTGIVYLLGKKMYSRSVGLWAAAIFAVSPLSVQYAQEARMYSLLMFSTALAMLAFVWLLELPGRWRAVLFGASLALVAYSHVYGYMVAVLFAPAVLLLPRVRRRVGSLLAIAYGAAAVVFLPWMLVIPRQVEQVLAASAGGSWWGEPVNEVVTDSVSRLMALSPSSGIMPSLLFATLFVVGLPLHFANKVELGGDLDSIDGLEETDATWVLLITAVLPVILGVAISKYVTMVATSRNTLVALPAVCLLVSRGAHRISSRRVMTLLLAILVFFNVAALPEYYASTDKGRWRDATTYVLDQDQRTAVIAETFEGGLQLGTYADILGRSDGTRVMYVSPGSSTDETAGLVQWKIEDEVDLPTYLERQDKVAVVSQWGETGRIDEYLSATPPWHVVGTEDFGDPLVKTWSRGGK